MEKEFNIDNYSAAEIERTKAAVEAMSNFVNNYGHSPELFARLMANEHRTLQQSFSKLMLVWLEYIATDEYRTDGRNEASQMVAKRLIKAHESWVRDNDPNCFGMPPSSWLRLI